MSVRPPPFVECRSLCDSERQLTHGCVCTVSTLLHPLPGGHIAVALCCFTLKGRLWAKGEAWIEVCQMGQVGELDGALGMCVGTDQHLVSLVSQSKVVPGEGWSAMLRKADRSSSAKQAGAVGKVSVFFLYMKQLFS